MISYISDLESGTGMGNYATQLYRHLAKQTGELENIPINSTDSSFAPRLINEFYKIPKAYYRSAGNPVLLPEMNYSGLAFIPTEKNLVATCHDIIPLVTDFAPWISKKLMQQQTRVMEKADAVIAISQHTKEDLVEYLGLSEKKITVIYQGVDTTFFNPEKRDETILGKYNVTGRYLLYVGSEKWRKNFEGLLRTFKKILNHYPDLTLVKVGTAGRRKYRAYHRKLVKDLSIEDSVVFTGFVDQEDLPQLYSSAEALILLSLYEGFGRPPLEAMACGTTPIVSNRTSLPEVVGNAGYKIDIKKDDIADSIIKSLDNPVDKEQLLSQANSFTWEQTARQTMKICDDVLV